jgi:hypothetical protein
MTLIIPINTLVTIIHTLESETNSDIVFFHIYLNLNKLHYFSRREKSNRLQNIHDGACIISDIETDIVFDDARVISSTMS